MRTLIVVLSLLLALWIACASYWYVCRVRGDCKCCPQQEQTAAPDTTVSPENALNASVEEAMTSLSNAGKQTVCFAPSISTADMNTLPADYITQLKLYLENTPQAKVTVTGHTDVTGTKEGNAKLSQARADFVRSFLISAGINSDQIQVLSKIDAEPAAPNNTAEGRAKNRRAEIELVK